MQWHDMECVRRHDVWFYLRLSGMPYRHQYRFIDAVGQDNGLRYFNRMSWHGVQSS